MKLNKKGRVKRAEAHSALGDKLREEDKVKLRV